MPALAVKATPLAPALVVNAVRLPAFRRLGGLPAGLRSSLVTVWPSLENAWIEDPLSWPMKKMRLLLISVPLGGLRNEKPLATTVPPAKPLLVSSW